VTLSDLIQRDEASRGLSTTTELLVLVAVADVWRFVLVVTMLVSINVFALLYAGPDYGVP